MLIGNNLIKTFIRNEKHNKKTEFNAVDEISVRVDEGEIVGIIGPNGAGKTTLLRMLGKLMKPTFGEVYYEDKNGIFRDENEIKKNIGYLSGNTKLYGRLTTRELLGIVARIYGMSEAETDEKIAEIAEVLSLADFIDNRIEKLSTGQTQRASISRCLIHNPAVYIFDEPTLGLDILSSSAIIEFMKKEREKGKSVIYSTHYMEEAEYLCDRIILLNRGRIISQGTLEELKKESGGENLREIFSSLIKKEGLDNE